MTRPRGRQKDEGAEVDLTDPVFQNAPESRAILALLRKLTDRFRDLPDETTDQDWTAFRALARAGAAEGIVRTTCTYADADGRCTEYFLVRGDYPSAMDTRTIRTTEPIEHVLLQARLTTAGVRWAEYLAAEKTQPEEKVRGFVLRLLWEPEPKPGRVQRISPPRRADAVAADLRAGEDEKRAEPGAHPTREPAAATEKGKEEEEVLSADEDLEVGLPEVDPYDRRVVNWIGRRLYLGHDTQVSRLFWLLVRRLGVPHDLAEVQRAVDRMETPPDAPGDEFDKAMNRVAKALSKLRGHLREDGLETHVFILKEGPRDCPTYTMFCRFGKY